MYQDQVYLVYQDQEYQEYQGTLGLADLGTLGLAALGALGLWALVTLFWKYGFFVCTTTTSSHKTGTFLLGFLHLPVSI